MYHWNKGRAPLQVAGVSGFTAPSSTGFYLRPAVLFSSKNEFKCYHYLFAAATVTTITTTTTITTATSTTTSNNNIKYILNCVLYRSKILPYAVIYVSLFVFLYPIIQCLLSV